VLLLFKKKQESTKKGIDKMKHLQKEKTVTVKVFYAKNGHLKERQIFDNALKAKRFTENLANTCDKE